MIDYIKIGMISNAHGIKGEVKVYPLTDNIKRFSKLKFVFLKTKDEYVKVEIQGVKYLKENVILKMANVETMNDALKYKNEYIYIDKENIVKLPRDSYFISDLMDMEVSTEEGELIGIITSVFPTGSNDVYEIKTPQGKAILIPAIKDVILTVDVENKKMTIKLLEGLV